MRKSFETGFTAILAISAIALVAIAAQRQLSKPLPSSQLDRVIDDWKQYGSAGHHIGLANAPVTIIEFSDYECVACERLRFSIDTLLRNNAQKVRFVYRHYPRPLTKEYSVPAANASECAGAQGKFFEYSNVLFDNQSGLEGDRWTEFARKANVPDEATFRSCIEHRKMEHLVQADADAAYKLRLSGTPALLINGRLFSGNRSTAQLEQLVSESLEK